MDVPVTEYAWNGDVALAYQVVGSGPVDLMYIPGWASHIELNWDDPDYARFLRGLASFTRLIIMDKRGTGLSDRLSPRELGPLETTIDDMMAVMEAVGSERAATLGHSEGGLLSALFAAAHPERAVAAVVFGGNARGTQAPDYPWGWTDDEAEQAATEISTRYGDDEFWDAEMTMYAPSLSGDAARRRWWGAYWRSSVGPSGAAALTRIGAQVDIRAVLPSVHVPTIVIHRTGDRTVPFDQGRDLAGRVPGAVFVELPGDDHFPWFGDQDAVIHEIERFLRSVRAEESELDRVLATVLFTDIVGSTEKVVELGDHAWKALVEHHHALVRSLIARYRGTEVDTAGDGFFATFDGPARAIRCGQAITSASHAIGLDVRAGLHTGECELIDGKVGGISVVIGARVAALADAGEVLVSSTVTDLVAGSGLAFDERGTHTLKGVPGEWRIYRARTPNDEADELPNARPARSSRDSNLDEMDSG